MDKRGFTTVELIVTMAFVVTIMFSITSVTYVYRDRSRYEELVTDIKDYTNTVTKIIYDDILDSNNKATRLIKIDNNNYKIKKLDNSEINLEVINRKVTKSGKEVKEVGIKYNNIEYLVPGSENSYVTLESVRMYPDDYEGEDADNLYGLDIIFSHENLEESFKIHFIILNT